jgi:uncharacterized protein
VTPRDAHYPGRAPVDSYGNGGFRFAGMSHRGSLLLVPSGIYGWEPPPAGVDLASLARVFDEADAIEVLLVGTGREMLPLDEAIRQALRERGIVGESMSTGAAVRTFKVLLAENRSVAAALVAVD